jgi:hypothetical protein
MEVTDVLEGICFVDKRLLKLHRNPTQFKEDQLHSHLAVAGDMFAKAHGMAEPVRTIGVWQSVPAREAHTDDFGNEVPARPKGECCQYSLRVPHG